MTIFLKEKLCHVIYKNVRARTRLSQRTLGKSWDYVVVVTKLGTKIRKFILMEMVIFALVQ